MDIFLVRHWYVMTTLSLRLHAFRCKVAQALPADKVRLVKSLQDKAAAGAAVITRFAAVSPHSNDVCLKSDRHEMPDIVLPW